MFQEPYQPVLADCVEERSNVRVDDPVDLACSDPIGQRIQRVVLATPGSEPVAKPQELRLVDRRQDRHHCRLDDLVLNGGDAERPLSAIRLRYVSPAERQTLDTSLRVPARGDPQGYPRGVPRIGPTSYHPRPAQPA